jgi:hypothetical protein
MRMRHVLLLPVGTHPISYYENELFDDARSQMKQKII